MGWSGEGWVGRAASVGVEVETGRRCGGAGLVEAVGRGRGGCRCGGGARWDHGFGSGRGLPGEARASGEPRPEETTGAKGGARETCRGGGAGPRVVAGPEAVPQVWIGRRVSGPWRRECSPLPCLGVFGVGAGALGSLKILEASRVAAGPEGPARPACASPEANLGLCRPGY